MPASRGLRLAPTPRRAGAADRPRKHWFTVQVPSQIVGYARGRISLGRVFSRHFSVIVSRSRAMCALSLRGLGGSSWTTCIDEHPRVAAERQLAGQKLEKNHAQRVDVAAARRRRVPSPAGLLGRHVGRRAEDLPLDGHRDFARLALGQAEVRDVRHGRRSIHEDVRRLQVAMDDALRHARADGLGDRATASSSRLAAGQLLAREPVLRLAPSMKSLAI